MTPPTFSRWVLARLAPPDLRASFVDDLDESFARRAARTGRRRARWWYRRQMLAALWTFLVLRLDRRATLPQATVDTRSRMSFLATIWWDAIAAARALRRRPWASGVVVASLALGVGASTAMFSVIDGVLLRPLNLPEPDRLLLIGERIPEAPDTVNQRFAFIDNPAAFLAWRKQATDFTALAAIKPTLFTLAGGGGPPQLLHGAHVSTNFFDVLGVRPQVGRALQPSDEGDSARPTVITDRLWRSTFNADRGVIGRRIGAAGAQATIVGVLPRDFRIEGRELGRMLAGQPTDFFDALQFQAGERVTAAFGDFNYHVIGRLRPGVAPTAALAQLDAIQTNLARTAPEKMTLAAQLSSMQDYAVADSRNELWLVFGGVVAVLLIVCVNLGGLSVARVADQRREWAIRAAIGAAPGRLIRQVLGESLLVAVLGGLAGVACAAAGLRALLAMAPADIPRLAEVHLSWHMLEFGTILSVAAGAVCGVVPALRLSGLDTQGHLKAESGAVTTDRASVRSRQVLVAVQAGMSTVLLVAAGLLGLSFYRLAIQPSGFDARHGVRADVMLGTAYTNGQRDQILRRLPASVAALPGVTSAAFVSHLPLEGETWINSIAVPGRVVRADQETDVNERFVSSGYFAAIGIPLLAGRDIAERDRPSGPPATSAATEPPGVVVLSRAAATVLWPGDPLPDLIGRALKFEGRTVFVVGISADARATLASPAPATAYSPYWEETPYVVSLVVRSATPASALAAPLRAAIWKLAPLAPVPSLAPLGDLEASASAPERYRFALLLTFAAIALLLAGMGVYALVAHGVARRHKELALRTTMGARATDLWRLVFGEGLAPVLAGVAAGLLTALAGGRVLASLLFQTSPTSPWVLASAAAAVLAAASAACVLSARAVVGADPWSALRSE